MDQEQLLLNTRIILQDLQTHTTDYLNLLTQPQKDDFVNDWNGLSLEAQLLSEENLLKKINEIIFKYPPLVIEFLEHTKIEEIRGVRFNVENVITNPKEIRPPINIPNEVVLIGDKIKELNKDKKK